MCEKSLETLNFGDTLANGATVIAHEGEIVLAHFPHSTRTPFVTWFCAPWDHSTCHGRYFENIIDATDDFRKRRTAS